MIINISNEAEMRWFIIMKRMHFIDMLCETPFFMILKLNKVIGVIFSTMIFFFFFKFFFEFVTVFVFLMIALCSIEECALVEIRRFPSKRNSTECFRPKSWVISRNNICARFPLRIKIRICLIRFLISSCGYHGRSPGCFCEMRSICFIAR